MIRGTDAGKVASEGTPWRVTEPDLAPVECFGADTQCIIMRSCRLRGVLHQGLDAFNAVLDKYTLADLLLGLKDFGVRPAA